MNELKKSCNVCDKPGDEKVNMIKCGICKTWLHLSCTDLTLSQFQCYSSDSSLSYFCILCIIENLPVRNIIHCLRNIV